MAIDDAEIDALYRLPLEEFTAARNLLAKRAGPRGAEIKKLEKPNLAAWAVNQLYWRERPAYDSLVDAAERLREEQRKQLGGEPSTVADAEERLKESLQHVKRLARTFLTSSGVASESVMTAIAETLDALPGPEAPGRLTKPIRRVGFGALAGITIVSPPRPVRVNAPTDPVVPAVDERALARAMDRLRFAEAAERDASAALERARRALDRTSSVVQRIEGELAEARLAEQAQREALAAAEETYTRAARDREQQSADLALGRGGGGRI